MRGTLLPRLWKWFKGKLPWTVKAQDAENDTLLHILHSEIEWRVARNIYIRDHNVCAMCGSVKKLEVHHVKPYSKFPALRYDQGNLITLCRECHFRFGHGRNFHKSNSEIRALAAYTADNLAKYVQ